MAAYGVRARPAPEVFVVLRNSLDDQVHKESDSRRAAAIYPAKVDGCHWDEYLTFLQNFDLRSYMTAGHHGQTKQANL